MVSLFYHIMVFHYIIRVTKRERNDYIMGSWGMGIFDNDTACDIKIYVEEGTVEERKTPAFWDKLFSQSVVKIVANGKIVNDFDAVLAFAALQLDYNILQESIKQEALTIIDTGEYTNFSTWFNQKDVPKRKKALAELKEKLLATNV